MRSRRRLRLFSTFLRRQLVVWSVLLTYCATIFGVPLPAAPTKDVSTPFPCQHRACGCMNADQCWKSCCCFSARERVAWAREHGVEPGVPVKAAEQPKQEDAEDSCCRETEGQTPSKPVVVTKPTCHQPSTSQDKPHGSTPSKPRSAKTGTVWVLGITARKCGGNATEWSNAPLALPSAVFVFTWSFEWLLVGWVSAMHLLLEGVPATPTVPPPR